MTAKEDILKTLYSSQNQSVMIGIMIQGTPSAKFLITTVEKIIANKHDGNDVCVLLSSHDLYGTQILDRLVSLSSIEAVRVYEGLRGQQK